MKNFEWQHIQFEDGCNPYICKTEKAFNDMRKRYNLVKLRENHGIGYWLAQKSFRELLAEVDKIEDDEEFVKAEFEIISEYCHKNNFEISAEDEDIIRARGLGGWFDDWKYEQEKYND